MVLQTVSMSQISKIDTVEQNFIGTFLLQFRFPGGASDACLSAKGSIKPAFEHGVMPSAEWYGDQIEITNAIGVPDKLAQKTFPDGEDLLMNVRYSGQFFEEMEMQMFPFDCQDLQVNVAVLCRNGGNLPVHLTIAPNLIAQVLPDGFQAWT